MDRQVWVWIVAGIVLLWWIILVRVGVKFKKVLQVFLNVLKVLWVVCFVGVLLIMISGEVLLLCRCRVFMKVQVLVSEVGLLLMMMMILFVVRVRCIVDLLVLAVRLRMVWLQDIVSVVILLVSLVRFGLEILVSVLELE